MIIDNRHYRYEGHRFRFRLHQVLPAASAHRSFEARLGEDVELAGLAVDTGGWGA